MTILGTWKQCFIMEENTPIDAPLICSKCGAITERNYNNNGQKDGQLSGQLHGQNKGQSVLENVLCMYCFYDLPETI